MSEHDDTLLDEDLGDEEYDLGNDEEEALLADDYEVDRQNSYKGEEETDDVLDLGVTDALDDLDGEDENIEFSRSNTDKGSDNNFYKDGEHADVQSYGQNENVEHETSVQSDGNAESISVNVSNNIVKGDLREKLQKNMQKNISYIGNGQEMEDDDCEEARERRNRFQNERTIVSPKMNNDIPETLENVVTSEPYRMQQFRGRGGKSRGARGGSRGGRFNVQNVGNFNPRFGMVRQGSNFVDNQPPVCRPPLIDTRPPLIETRPPLLESRPPFHLGVSSNVQNQQIMYQQANPQQPFQQPFGPSGPIQGPPTQFPENRPQFNPGQFQGLMGPRPMSPRLPEYPGSRGPLLARPMQGGSNYNCGPNHPPMQSPMQPPIPSPMQSSMQQPFQNPGGILQENHHRPMPGPPGLLPGNPGRGSLLGTPNMPSGNAPHMLPSGGGNPPMPIQGFPRQQQSMLPPSQGLPVPNLPPNVQMPPNQPPHFENRPPPPPPFQESHYQDRNAPYDTRPGYHPDQMSGGQFNDTMQQTSSNMLPPGHKILINPHFRGTVQPTNDARLAWDSNQQVQQISHGEQFPPTSSYQNQGSYNQHDPPSQNYQQNYQQNKSDDPYAYFSDVWQENRPQKPQNTSPIKHYSSDSNYFREENYSDKYKSDSQWDQKNSYQEDHKRSYQSYREGDLPRRTIRNEHAQRSKTPPSTYRSDHNHNPKPRPSNAAPSGANRPQKRLSESSDKESREVISKRVKPLVSKSQGEQKTESAKETVAKEEDSDPEMQEYRKKMEEQKRLREKILLEKENRRKRAAMEKQNEDTKNDSNVAANESTQQETKPVSALMGIVKDGVSTVTPRPAVKGRGRPVNTQSAEATERPSNVRIIRTVPIVQTNDSSDTTGLKDKNSGEIAQTIQVVQQSSSRRVVIHNPQKVVTTIQKTISNTQKNQGLQQQKVSNTQVVHPQKIVQNQANAFQKPAVVGSKTVPINQRMMTSKGSGLQKIVINENVNTQRIANMQQNSQRIVLQKSGVQVKRSPEIKTNTVRLENLAASTSEAQIRRMCHTIGTIESIHMGEGNATIVFKTQSAAMVFHKKYQRKMLDLSLITVRLMPQSTPDNKVATAVAKTS